MQFGDLRSTYDDRVYKLDKLRNDRSKAVAAHEEDLAAKDREIGQLAAVVDELEAFFAFTEGRGNIVEGDAATEPERAEVGAS